MAAPMTCMPRRQDRARGQAMVEFLVTALFFLVPLFLAVAALGKFSDVQHVAELAGRYAAWERTVWYDADSTGFAKINEPNQKSALQINNEAVARLLNDRSKAGTVIKDSDKSAGTLVNGLDPMWKDAQGVAFLDDYQQVGSAVAAETPKSDFAGAVLSVVNKIQVNGLASLAPPLPTATMAVASVSFQQTAAKSTLYQRLWSETAFSGLDFSGRGAILSNTWAANARGSTEAMVRAAVPTAQAPGAAFLTAAQGGMAAWDPLAPIGMEVGKIAVDVVPEDTLK